MSLTNAPLIFRRVLATLAVISLASIALAAALCAGETSAATHQSLNAPPPTPTPVEEAEPEFPLPLTSASVVIHGEAAFESVTDYDTGKRHLILNPGAQVIIEPTDYSLHVEDQRDFNGDGVVDALISFDQGGNCCPSVYAFLTIYNGKAFASALNEVWAQYTVDEERGYPVVAQKHLEATDYWRLEGTNATIVDSKPKLQAIAEIRGVGALYTGPEDETHTLSVDIDDDGVTDSITCGIWPRWGILVHCELSLPEGITQTIDGSCDRLGALKTVRNGMHELVCNNDIVIYFDGKEWRTDTDKEGPP